MTQTERRKYLLKALLKEDPRYSEIEIPASANAQKQLLRSLFNVRLPKKIDPEFLAIQDAYLQEETKEKGITNLADLQPIAKDLYLWQGDSTTLRCDAIVNAANSRMTGCYQPCHNCIDNSIHTYAGIQLRLECAALMEKQGQEEETGKAKITSAYNLPARFILHTVGPIVQGKLRQQDCDLLAACYRSCLELAEQKKLKSVAFCCISTGVFRFPSEKAAQIAVESVKQYKEETGSQIEVIFNVFKDRDYQIYKDLLSANQ